MKRQKRTRVLNLPYEIQQIHRENMSSPTSNGISTQSKKERKNMVGKLTPNDMMSCSRLPALLGFSKFRTPNDELKQSIEHYQGIEPEFIENEPMLWGNLTEKLILAEAVKRLGCEIDNLDHKEAYFHESIPLACSLDGTAQGAGTEIFTDIGNGIYVMNDGTGIPYADAQWILNDVLIFNKATITRAGGSPQVALNQASIDKYFLHSYFLDNLLMQSDAVALDYAQAYVASRQETSIRVDNITLDLYTPNYNSGVIAALNLDFFDPITVSTTQPGGSILTKTLQIFGVAMNITPNSWKTTFTTLEPVIDAFILNNSIYGTLDYNVLSY